LVRGRLSPSKEPITPYVRGYGLLRSLNSVMLGSPLRAEKVVEAEVDASCHAVTSTIAIGPGYASAVLLGGSYNFYKKVA
jgi:hypothetical protein